MWRKVSRVKAPPKGLNFFWRALSQCLPTMTMLWNKFIPVVDICPVCTRNNETIIHAFVECQFSRQCWRTEFSEVMIEVTGDFQQWLGQNFSIVNNDCRAKIATMCWAIWKARNGLVWNQKQVQLNDVIASVKQYLVQWRNAQS